MKLASYRDLPLPRDKVWSIINDLEVLKKCIPGCQSLERKSDESLAATVVTKIGPISAKFGGALSFENIKAPESYRIVFSGQGGAAGFAKGHADVSLEPTDTGSRLTYTSEANIGGKLAQIGSRLIESTANKLADEFFSRLEDEIKKIHEPSAQAESSD